MNRTRLLVVGMMLTFGFTTVAQQTTTTAAKDVSGDAHNGRPSVERHVQLLSEKLDLNSDQQAKVKPVLQEMDDATQKFAQDESMSRDERMDNVKAARYKADKKIRQILSDDQKKKLDQLEQEMPPELHGNMNGSTPPAQAPQN